MMKLSDQTIKAFGTILAGSNGHAPHRSGQELVQFFNQFGFQEHYNNGLPSKSEFACNKLQKLNGTITLSKVFTKALDPRAFVGSGVNVDDLVEDLNKFLESDGYQLVKQGDYFYARELVSGIVDIETPRLQIGKVTLLFLNKKINAANEKLAKLDFSGALGEARKLLETVLVEIEKSLDPEHRDSEKDLIKLYQHVQKLLNLSPEREDLPVAINQVLGGLAVISEGLAALHNSPYKLARHHAKLAVNTSRILAEFLFETYIYQYEKGLISPVRRP